MYDQPPSAAAIAAAAAGAAAWLLLAAWSGYQGLTAFPGFALVYWSVVLLVLLAAQFFSGTDAVLPGHEIVLLLMFVVVAPLHGLSGIVPLQEQMARYAVVAAVCLALSLVTYGLVRRTVVRRSGVKPKPAAQN